MNLEKQQQYLAEQDEQNFSFDRFVYCAKACEDIPDEQLAALVAIGGIGKILNSEPNEVLPLYALKNGDIVGTYYTYQDIENAIEFVDNRELVDTVVDQLGRAWRRYGR